MLSALFPPFAVILRRFDFEKAFNGHTGYSFDSCYYSRGFIIYPIVSCDIDIPQKSLEAVKSEAEGLYSNKLPLVPVYVRVSDYSDSTVFYTINYFPFGSVDMSFNEADGYNIEKPLSSLS